MQLYGEAAPEAAAVEAAYVTQPWAQPGATRMRLTDSDYMQGALNPVTCKCC